MKKNSTILNGPRTRAARAIAAISALLAVVATACGTATAGDAPTGQPAPTPSRSIEDHIEPPRVVDRLDLVRQSIEE